MKYTREELIKILEELSLNLAWVQCQKERAHLKTEEENQKVNDFAESLNKNFSRILDPKYWDSAITVQIIQIYLETGQAQTVEQAVALYEKNTPFNF